MAGIDYTVLLDENERQRMLADGYLPEVIEFHAKERFTTLQQEFLWKNRILGRYYEDTPYYTFVADVFPDVTKLMVVTGESTYREMDPDELMEYQSTRADVYVTPASFIQGCYSGATCKDIYAFVVDIDKVHPETLDVIIEKGTLGRNIPMPTYVVNSGRGVHFYYVFESPVPHYYKNRKILKDMYRTLCGITAKNIYAKTDWHAITQPFRLPGTLTKLGQVVTGWKCGEKWAAQALAERLRVDAADLELSRVPLLPQKEYLEKKESREKEGTPAKKKKKKKKQAWVSSMAGKTGFYLRCLEKCYRKTPEGTRYLSMCALTVVARKVEYPKEKLEEDLVKLLEYYNNTGKSMKPSEVKKALRMYNEKALKTRSKTLEDWFGWEFDRLEQKMNEKKPPDPNRPKLTRTEILEEARLLRDVRMKRLGRKWDDNNGRKSKELVVKEWRQSYPEGTPKECIAETGLSKNTVYKWWKGAAE